jgi:hypothetical protein
MPKMKKFLAVAILSRKIIKTESDFIEKLPSTAEKPVFWIGSPRSPIRLLCAVINLEHLVLGPR